jgi:hypothetical protein
MSESKNAKLSQLIAELCEAAGRMGIEVRRERILREVGYRARGGACRLRERNLIILDREIGLEEQAQLLAQALRGTDLEALYLSPAARRLVEAGAETG